MVALSSAVAWLIRRWTKDWEDALAAQAKLIQENKLDIASHGDTLIRHDEKHKGVEKTLSRIEKGIVGVNERLDNVIGNNRSQG